MLTSTTPGIGAPFANAVPNVPWALSPQGVPQGFGFQPPYLQPISSQLLAGYGGQPIGAYGAAVPTPLLQLQQLLQLIPQQLQQIQLLQQQQLIQLQQLLQQVPLQLQQLAQTVFQNPWQPLAQTASGAVGLGVVPPIFAGPLTGHVM